MRSRQPSRRMLAAPRPTLDWAVTTLLLAVLAAGCGLILFLQPFVAIFLGVVVVATIALSISQGRALAQLAAERPGESICTFARSFDRRATDTWIIRAVFEELQPWTQFRGGTLPIRPEDDLEAILRIDPEVFDELIGDIAQRARRSLKGWGENPLVGQVRTVADLVALLVHQPVLKPASP